MRLIGFLIGILATIGQVVAADEIKVNVPSVVGGNKSTAMQWIITAAFLVGTLIVAFKPAKRSKLE